MKKHGSLVSLVLSVSFVLSSCGPSQLFGPTITPSPTSTLTPTITPSPTLTLTPTITFTPTIIFTPTQTPIPGFEAPVVMDNGIGVQIHSAVGHAELPYGYRLASGYDALLNIEMIITGISLPENQIVFDQFTIMPGAFGDLVNGMTVVDEDGNEGYVNAISPIHRDGRLVLSFVVKEAAKKFSLHLPNTQVIDLTPILKFDTNWINGIVTLDGKPLENTEVNLTYVIYKSDGTLDKFVTFATETTNVNGEYLFTNVSPPVLRSSYELSVTVESEGIVCDVFDFSVGFSNGWGSYRDFILDKTLFSLNEAPERSDGLSVHCKSK